MKYIRRFLRNKPDEGAIACVRLVARGNKKGRLSMERPFFRKEKRMKITILAVGRIREKFYRDALAEYSKRLSRYCRLEITETADEKTDENMSVVQMDLVKAREAERLFKYIREDAYCIALAIEGKKLDSVAFSQKLEKLQIAGKSNIVFVIGGSLGLHKSVLQRADELLSFSDMTFPHPLMRVILLEQVYRGFRILNHEPYHK